MIVKKILFAFLLALFATPVFAQATYPTVAGQRVNGVVPLQCDAAGINCAPATAAAPLLVSSSSSGTGTTSDRVQGAGPASAAAVGDPVGVGGLYVSSLPTYTTGQRSNFITDSFGNQRAKFITDIATGADDVSNNALGLGIYAGNQASVTYLGVFNYAFDGTTWDRFRTINGALTTGAGTQAVAMAPSTAAAAAIAPVPSTIAEGSRVFKSGAGNAFTWRVTTGIVGGYVLIFDATSAPADGVVTPIDCVAVAANSTVGSNMDTLPDRFTTGYTIVFSSTGCFTKTISATAFIRAKVL